MRTRILAVAAIALAGCTQLVDSEMPPAPQPPPPPPQLRAVGGTVTGLTGTVVLRNNGGDDLTVSANGAFAFATKVAKGAAYAVTVKTQPAHQSCAVTNGGGLVGDADVTNVSVACTTNAYSIGGTVAGLQGSGLVLRNNGGDSLAVGVNGGFTFQTSLTSGSTYAVTVSQQPTGPHQTCTVTNGTGTALGNVTDVAVACTTNTYRVGGTIAGLSGTVVLRNNGGDPLALDADGVFTFATAVPSGGAYAVTVGTQPTHQTCTVTNGGGVVAGANVTGVSVTCTAKLFTVGGTVAGLAGSGLVLRNNGGDDLPVSANGPFTFATKVASGTAYAVTVVGHPANPAQTCTVTSGSGTALADVTDVAVACTTNRYRIGGTVSGLGGGGIVLRNNGGDDLALAADGAFTFATSIVSGGTYAVTVLAPPPQRLCTVLRGSGTVTAADVTDVAVSCASFQESCAACHGAGQASSFAARHAVPRNEVTVEGAGPLAAAGANLTMTFTVKVDGVPRDGYAISEGFVLAYPDPSGVTTPGGYLGGLPVWGYGLSGLGGGAYSLTVNDYGPLGAYPAAPGTMFLFNLVAGPTSPVATVVGTWGPRVQEQVSNAACTACHGQYVFRARDPGGLPIPHHGSNPAGLDACVVCHDRADAVESRLGGTNTRLMGWIHGIHASESMAAGMGVDIDPSPGFVTNQNPAGYYHRDGLATPEAAYSIGFPGHVQNCATCHATEPQRLAVADAPVSWARCMSCHNDWNGFQGMSADIGLFSTHAGMHRETACGGCHDGASAPATIARYHDGLRTERAGVIWGGADQSVLWGRRVRMEITGVSYDPAGSTTLAVTWTAGLDQTGDGTLFVPVDPCNSNVAAGPIFHRVSIPAGPNIGVANFNFSLLRTYALANDWVNGVSSSAALAPGQPLQVSLTATNTTCAGNVATTRVAAEPTTATRALVALQGRPQLRFDPAIGTSVEVIPARSQTPTREFIPATGAVPVTARREIVSIDKCNACHLGSLFNHGSNRTDRIELCVGCHNPAGTDQPNRVGMGVDAGTAYDRRAGQAIDFRTLIHALHASDATGKPLVLYRNNGVYLFGSRAALAAVPTWPGDGCQTVSGSTRSSTSNCDLSPPGPGIPAKRIHYFNQVRYPRALNDCGACHVNGTEQSPPDPRTTVAVVEDVGGAAPSNQLDDALIGVWAAACLSCHRAADPAIDGAIRTHVFDAGWYPSPFPEGRQTILDSAP